MTGNWLIRRIERIGEAGSFAVRVIWDSFHPPFEIEALWMELADQGWRSLPLIVSSGLALAACGETQFRG